jgi:hypothetical protein
MWRFQIDQTPLPVRGMSIFLITAAKQIDAVFMELPDAAHERDTRLSG